MNRLFHSIGVSKQAFHQHMDRMLVLRSEQQQLLLLIYQIREDHPTMGLRDMYYMLNPESMGRDAFEAFCKEEGLSSKRAKNYRKTTDSLGVIRFDNLLENMELTGINQAWVSDITYYELKGKFYYLTFIIDAFSRRIIGHSCSTRLTTEQTTLPALAMAITVRATERLDISGLIFHSDGGGQYYDKEFLRLTQKHGFKSSMCEYAWENGKAERVNGVIKNNYLKHWEISDYNQLAKSVDRSVWLYNNEKPHLKLQRTSPIKFEKSYIWCGQQSDGGKSATELITQHKGNSALRAVDNNPPIKNRSGINEQSKVKKQLKTVNLI